MAALWVFELSDSSKVIVKETPQLGREGHRWFSKSEILCYSGWFQDHWKAIKPDIPDLTVCWTLKYVLLSETIKEMLSYETIQENRWSF